MQYIIFVHNGNNHIQLTIIIRLQRSMADG